MNAQSSLIQTKPYYHYTQPRCVFHITMKCIIKFNNDMNGFKVGSFILSYKIIKHYQDLYFTLL